MSRASAGPAPWTEGFKRLYKKRNNPSGYEWSLRSGYRKKLGDDRDRYRVHSKTKKIKLYNGKVVEVPDADYEDFIGHHKSASADANTEIAKYIERAISSKLYSIKGAGHIANIEYSVTYQILQATFNNDGAIVVYFRVPKEVFSELKYLSESSSVYIDDKGIPRHLLGKRFWDIIRIRGQREGSRYRYEYTTDGTRTGTEFSRSIDSMAQTDRTEAEHRAKSSNQSVDKIMSEQKQDEIDSMDIMAKNFLKGETLKKYQALNSLKEKTMFLRRANIL